ncbi:MAG: YdeI/OmpD-associated family protein [Bacteroidota bacterium]
MDPRVDLFLEKAGKWQKEMEALRNVVLSCELEEELKWGKPCYSVNKGNVVIIQGFKEYCALMFFKGALLQDPAGILLKTGENTQSGRQVRFTGIQKIREQEELLREYIFRAAEVEKSGAKVELKKTADYEVPDEFQSRLDSIPQLKKAFYALTPGRQRAYLLHFSGARQSATRSARVEKCIPLILSGKGLND